MAKTLKRKIYRDTLSIDKLNTESNDWQFLFIQDTAFLTLRTGVFVTDGDLIILRPKEKCYIPQGFNAYKCISVADSFIRKTLDLFSPVLCDKWKNTESLIVSLSDSSEFCSMIKDAQNAQDGYSKTFIIKQVVLSCIAETIRKAKYGQQALPAVVVDALELMKQPEILAGTFANFRKKSGMSETNMVRLFSRCNLEVPSEVFRKEKFAKAREWAKNGELISEIAKKIGYSTKGFIAVYKEYYGVSPTKDGAKNKKIEIEIKE